MRGSNPSIKLTINVLACYVNESIKEGGGGAVAEWSKALLERKKINEKHKVPRFAPRPGQSLKKYKKIY